MVVLEWAESWAAPPPPSRTRAGLSPHSGAAAPGAADFADSGPVAAAPAAHAAPDLAAPPRRSRCRPAPRLLASKPRLRSRQQRRLTPPRRPEATVLLRGRGRGACTPAHGGCCVASTRELVAHDRFVRYHPRDTTIRFHDTTSLFATGHASSPRCIEHSPDPLHAAHKTNMPAGGRVCRMVSVCRLSKQICKLDDESANLAELADWSTESQQTSPFRKLVC
eukprot:scaffold132361_cov69-Phaeocystis_antarctica.AAC.3